MASKEVAWTLNFDLAEFSGGEAEAITGVSMALQRNWRYRGLLPEIGTRARYTVFDLAELAVMTLYSTAGRGPTETRGYARKIAIGMASQALRFHAQWAGERPEDVFDRIPVATRALHASEAFYMVHPELLRPDMTEPNGRAYLDPTEKREWLIERLVGAACGDGFQIVDGPFWWTDAGTNREPQLTVQDLREKGRPERMIPPDLAFPIDANAHILALLAPRAFAAVRLDLNPDYHIDPEAAPTDQGRVVVSGRWHKAENEEAA